MREARRAAESRNPLRASCAARAVAAVVVAALLVPAARGAPAGDGGPGSVRRYVIVPEQSQARYRAQEVFLGIRRPGRTVGATSAIEGEILVDQAHFSHSRPGVIRVDIEQLASDDPARDRAIRERWLQSSRFPVAEFRTVAVEGLPDTYPGAERVSLVLHGDLTIRGVTRPVRFQGWVIVEDGVLRGAAATTIRLSDFGIEPPSILGLLRVEDQVDVEVDLVARRFP